MGMLKEFKEFAMRGNVLDLAIGVIIGAAFGAIVNSAVNDILMPPIGMAAGKIDFKDLFVSLNGQPYASLAAAKAAGAPVIAYGAFVNTVINFLIVAFIIFLIVKQVNRFNKPAEAPAAAPSTKECPYCANSVPIKAVRCGYCTSQLA
jgi:large conductance mechanosensitive channel